MPSSKMLTVHSLEMLIKQKRYIQKLWGSLLGIKTEMIEGNPVNSVECTEDNIVNLYKSQFEDRTTYGEVYRYIIYKNNYNNGIKY